MVPRKIADADGRLLAGRWAGPVPEDPVPVGPRRGRVRRWRYAAAGDGTTVVGAAVVDLGFLGVAFAFATVDGRTLTYETRRPLGRGLEVGTVPSGGAAVRIPGGRLAIGGAGGLDLDLPTDQGRLVASVTVTDAGRPLSLATPTAGGGWNVTEKTAGYPAEGEVRAGDASVVLSADAGGWSDWTAGRQDRRTTWRWAAGAGRAADGRRVGLNLSTGMNGVAEGEDVVWWEGEPAPLRPTALAPVGADPAGDWRVEGVDWGLAFAPLGVRAEHVHLGVLTSSYTQPIGRFTGTLPDPEGRPTEVTLAGVTEDHLAVW